MTEISSSPASENKEPQGHTPIKISDIKHPVFWAGLLIIAAIFLRAVVLGKFGQLGFDSDDVMRFVQARDYLNGQSWFDTDQLRLGIAGGTDMHWSRLVDAPLIILAKVFGLFMKQESALMLASSVWPPLTAALFIYAIAKAARYYDLMISVPARVTEKMDNTALAFTLILLAFFTIQFYRFEPGAIDHHNVQMGLVALAMAGGLDPKLRFSTHFIAGAAIAVSVAIGTEVYIFAGAVCAYMVVNWLMRGAEAKDATKGFGLGLASALAVSFFATISPSEYGLVKCDSLSLITLCAGMAGGLGLAMAAQLSSVKSLSVRLGACAGIGLLCGAVFLLQGPQCLANPLSDIPEDVTRLWLDQVQEARPLWDLGSDWLVIIPLTLGPALLGLYVLIKKLREDAQWSSRWLILFLLVSSILLSVYQLRFGTFSYVFALVPLSAWIAGLHRRGKAKAEATENGSNIAYLGALALSIPIIWLLPAIITQLTTGVEETDREIASGQIATCFSEDVMLGLNILPAGTIASTSNGGDKILRSTEHRALSGNYHRNIAGISAQIHLATAAPDKARSIMTDAGVNYVHFCQESPETTNLVNENENGLYAGLSRGQVPSYLTQILSLEEGGVLVYRVD